MFKIYSNDNKYSIKKSSIYKKYDNKNNIYDFNINMMKLYHYQIPKYGYCLYNFNNIKSELSDGYIIVNLNDILSIKSLNNILNQDDYIDIQTELVNNSTLISSINKYTSNNYQVVYYLSIYNIIKKYGNTDTIFKENLITKCNILFDILNNYITNLNVLISYQFDKFYIRNEYFNEFINSYIKSNVKYLSINYDANKFFIGQYYELDIKNIHRYVNNNFLSCYKNNFNFISFKDVLINNNSNNLQLSKSLQSSINSHFFEEHQQDNKDNNISEKTRYYNRKKSNNNISKKTNNTNNYSNNQTNINYNKKKQNDNSEQYKQYNNFNGYNDNSNVRMFCFANYDINDNLTKLEINPVSNISAVVSRLNSSSTSPTLSLNNSFSSSLNLFNKSVYDYNDEKLNLLNDVSDYLKNLSINLSENNDTMKMFFESTISKTNDTVIIGANLDYNYDTIILENIKNIILSQKKKSDLKQYKTIYDFIQSPTIMINSKKINIINVKSNEITKTLLETIKFNIVKNCVNILVNINLTKDKFKKINKYLLNYYDCSNIYYDFEINKRLRLTLANHTYYKKFSDNNTISSKNKYHNNKNNYYQFRNYIKFVNNYQIISDNFNNDNDIDKCCKCCKCIEKYDINYYEVKYLPYIEDLELLSELDFHLFL